VWWWDAARSRRWKLKLAATLEWCVAPHYKKKKETNFRVGQGDFAMFVLTTNIMKSKPNNLSLLLLPNTMTTLAVVVCSS
jgi:hypothetical protein